MNQNVMHRLLLIKVTEIMEVTEKNTLIENVVLEVEQGLGYVPPVVAGIFTNVPPSNWVQPELNESPLNASVADVVIPLLGVFKNMNKEE